jgi:hypothetical protein
MRPGLILVPALLFSASAFAEQGQVQPVPMQPVQPLPAQPQAPPAQAQPAQPQSAQQPQQPQIIYVQPPPPPQGQPQGQPPVIYVQAPPPTPPGRPAEEEEESRWYGWQTLIVDAAATALTIGYYQQWGYGYVGFIIGPPIVHFAHGRVGIGFADMGVRLGAPVLLAVGGFLLGGGGGPNGSSRDLGTSAAGAVIGFLIGYTGAIALDAAVFAREKVKRDPRAAGVQLQSVPIRDIDGRMKLTGVGVGGQF